MKNMAIPEVIEAANCIDGRMDGFGVVIIWLYCVRSDNKLLFNDFA